VHEGGPSWCVQARGVKPAAVPQSLSFELGF